MRYGWARTAAVLAMAAAVAACGGGAPATGDAEAAENLREAQFFMTSNAKAEGVKSLPSGVQYKVLQAGPAGGERPDGNDLVRVDYEGSLTDGTVFDSSFQRGQPAVFTVEDGISGSVITGMRDALQHMSVGDEWLVYIPPEIGYGDAASGNIPPNSVLIFRLKLLDVAQTPGGETALATANG
ncbi:MAG: FKBP-type peptidyl-prolyl cis-trans isomerase [Alphaproteobacteria bacterium]|nr:FKBP-type peptidyl-prolyl cis-trans isomerase [Alphaproteobacteria bacterium]MBU2270843.1 FKBP-type peptidyl-prolyl cis-trans isomerase [Alphaproteobacteria bacterium]MBU2417561.1 FKBP-type peptidyl-prolyl cis-trans isomerase [Alphaproteobacteria bacterium]